MIDPRTTAIMALGAAAALILGTFIIVTPAPAQTSLVDDDDDDDSAPGMTSYHLRPFLTDKGIPASSSTGRSATSGRPA